MINSDKTLHITGIYKITSPTSKVYIGQSIDIHQRWKFYSFFNCKNQIQLYNSLKKYGYKKHKFEILETCSIDELDHREIYWKNYYLDKFNNNWKKVLFCKLYDSGGGPLNENIKQKISKSLLGKNKTPTHKNNISKARTGMSFTQQHKDNMSSSRFRHSIICLENNKIYKSASQAAKDLNIFPSSIIKVCEGKYKQTKGYTFKFV
jgi:group I intron endonuclease